MHQENRRSGRVVFAGFAVAPVAIAVDTVIDVDAVLVEKANKTESPLKSRKFTTEGNEG